MSLFCLLRRLTGRFYYLLVACLPGVLASWLAIQVERPGRRPALAFYVLNIASQTLLNRLGAGSLGRTPALVRRLAQLLVFGTASGYLLHTAARKGYPSDLLGSALRWLLGPLDVARSTRSSADDGRRPEAAAAAEAGTQRRCPHRDSCVRNQLTAFARPLLACGLAQTLMPAVWRPSLLLRPIELLQKSRTPGFFRPSLFVASFALAFKVGDRRSRNCDFCYLS